MASIKLKHTSGNGTIIHSPAANPSNDVTLKLPSTTGSAGQVLKVASANHSSTNAELEFGADAGGAMKQLKSVTKTDSTSTTSTSYVDISGMSVTLTPESGTKCYVTYHLVFGMGAGWMAGVQLLRDSTAIGNGDQYNANNFYASRGGFLTDQYAYIHGGNLDYGFLDTHGANGSTAVTYKLQWISPYPQQPAIYLNRSGAGSGNYTYEPNYFASTLTVMEVAA